MNPKTTTALAFSGAALALPAAALGAGEHPPGPERTLLRAAGLGQQSVRAQMHAARRIQRVHALTVRAVHLQERIGRLRGVHVSAKTERRRLRGATPEHLRRVVRRREHELASARQPAAGTASAPAAGGSTASPNLQAIAACESGGNPAANTGNGFYGKYQFTQQTWASVGGTGNPAAASEAEQDARAAQLYAQSGSSPWPVCGR